MSVKPATNTKRFKDMKPSTREAMYGMAFLSLSFLGYIIFKLVPVIIAMVLSFCDWNLVSGISGIKFVWLENYFRLFRDPIFIKSMNNTFVFTIVTVPVSIFLSLVIGVILNDKVYAKGLIRINFYIPNISSTVAISVVWSMLFLPSSGLINMFLRSLHVQNPPGWLSSSSWSLISVMIVSIWQSVGYNVIIVLSGLQSISPSLYEAANIDGANSIQKFVYVTIPAMSSTFFFLMITCLIKSFQVFTQVKIMTQGGPGSSSSVLVYYIYKTAFEYSDIGYASAMSWMLFIIVFAITSFQWKHEGSREREV